MYVLGLRFVASAIAAAFFVVHAAAEAPAGAATGLFPLPKRGFQILYSVGPNRYAHFEVLERAGHAMIVQRKVWEGSAADRASARGEQVSMVMEVPLGSTLPGQSCTITAAPAALRNLAPGAVLNYTRRCTRTVASNTAPGTFTTVTTATIVRTVQGRRTVALAQGRLEGTMIDVRTRSTTRSHFPNRPDAWWEETGESVDRMVWAEQIGFFVERTTSSRRVALRVSPAYLAANEALGADGVAEANRMRRLASEPPGQPYGTTWQVVEYSN